MKPTQILVRLVLILVLLAIGTAIVLFIHHIGHPRIIARATAPDGTEMCIVQQCNWSGEPFTARASFTGSLEQTGAGSTTATRTTTGEKAE